LQYVVFGAWEQNIEKLCEDIRLKQLNEEVKLWEFLNERD